jgi:hypothetical protein
VQKDREAMVLGFDWTYDNAGMIEPPLEVMLGNATALQDWINANRAELIDPIKAAPVPMPTSVWDGLWQTMSGGYDLLQVRIEYAPGSLLYNKVIGSFIGRPAVVDPNKPMIIAMHGHEVAHRGDPPAKLWLDHWWPEALVQAGFVVMTPPHLPYAQLASLASAHDYHAVWTKFVWGIVTASLSPPSGAPAFNGMMVAGLSSGGTTASLLMAWRPEILRGVFAGSLLPMEFLRQNYRIINHPDSWNLRNVYSYLPYYLLCADRAVQWQMGKADPFYPDHAPMAPQGTWFPGTDRDVMVTEILGEYTTVRDAAAKLGGKADLVIHEGGHEFRVREALTFLTA